MIGNMGVADRAIRIPPAPPPSGASLGGAILVRRAG